MTDTNITVNRDIGWSIIVYLYHFFFDRITMVCDWIITKTQWIVMDKQYCIYDFMIVKANIDNNIGLKRNTLIRKIYVLLYFQGIYCCLLYTSHHDNRMFHLYGQLL